MSGLISKITEIGWDVAFLITIKADLEKRYPNVYYVLDRQSRIKFAGELVKYLNQMDPKRAVNFKEIGTGFSKTLMQETVILKTFNGAWPRFWSNSIFLFLLSANPKERISNEQMKLESQR